MMPNESISAVDLLLELRNNLDILIDRQAQYGSLAAPLELINSIEGHRAAIEHLEQAIAVNSVTPQMRDQVARLLINSKIVVLIDPARRTFTGVNPYRGLNTFAVADAEFFCGRSQATEELYALVVDAVTTTAAAASGWITVIGASGSGKSSLVQAGLIPRLQQEPAEQRTWSVLKLEPGEHPIERLAGLLAPLVKRSSVELFAELNSGSNALRLVIGEIQAAQPDSQVLLLFIDQFEEIFVQCRDASERAAFVDLLKAAAHAGSRRFVLLATLRADFYGQAISAGLDTELKQQQYIVKPMQKHELREAILLPAEKVGLEIERELALALVQDTGSDSARLPLLQYTLAELFEHKSADHVLTMAAYTAMEGVQGALIKRANQLYDDFTPEQQFIAQQLFIQLTDIDHTESYVSRRTYRTQLEHLGSAEDVQTVISALSHDRERLIIVADDIQVIHEVLLQHWPKLHTWVQSNKHNIAMHRKLTERAVDWWQHNQDLSYLLFGFQLESAREWAFDYGHRVMHPVEHVFLQTSLREAEAIYQRQLQTARNLRRRAVIASVFGVVALVMMGTALIAAQLARSNAAEAKRRADSSLAQALVLQAPALPDSEQGLLVALAAAQINPPDAPVTFNLVAEALEEILLREYQSTTLPPPSNPDVGVLFSLNTLMFSADGQQLIGSSLSEVWQWDVHAIDAPVRVFENQEQQSQVLMQPTQHYVAAVYADHTLQLIDRTRQDFQNLASDARGFERLAFSPSGTWLVAASKLDDQSRSTLLLWDMRDLAREPLRIDVDDLVASIAFSPDEQLLALGINRGALTGNVLLYQLAAQPKQLFSLKEGLFADDAYTGPAWAVAFSADGTTLAASLYNTVLLFDVAQPDSAPVRLPAQPETLWSLALSSDSHYIVAGGTSGTLFVWNLQQLRPGLAPERLKLHADFIQALAFSPDGTLLASTDIYGTTKLLSFKGTAPAAKLLRGGHSGPISALAVSTDSTYLVSGEISQMYGWNLQVAAPEPQQFPIYIPGGTLAFSADGRWLVSAGVDIDKYQ